MRRLNVILWQVVIVALYAGATGQTVSTTWQSADGTRVNPLEPRKGLSVLIFVLTDCPISNKYAPEIGRIVRHFEARQVRFTLVYVDAHLSAAAARKHLAEYSLDCGAILDPTHTLAQSLNVTTSPETVVLSSQGRTLYRGRIDNRVAAYGKVRPEPTRRDLSVALTEALTGKPISVPKTNAIGCIFRADELQPPR